MRNAIALVLIARNGSALHRACRARAHVDEMIVLDTGSTDAAREIAALRRPRYRPRGPTTSAPRAPRARTPAPWRLVLDADEWIAAGAESLSAIRAREPGFLGLLRVDSVVNDERGAAARAELDPRLLPAGVHYEGRIHEQPAGALPRERLALVIGHDGYLDHAREAKAGRNERLLRMALAENPGDATVFITSSARISRCARASPRRCPTILKRIRAGEAAAAWRHDLVVRLIFTLKKLKQFAEAVELAGTRARTLERFARLLLHPRRPVARLGAGRTAAPPSCCRRSRRAGSAWC